ncbi:hypothetical protein EVAR_22469_1 [Eumeta japonica]|uniref:Uncharacterized protein n=1 Tax=Eumeta variegata TaxID=151549 RepID=A0A4C1VDI9_EUMVA|nr:hypothetical protein EVAR_22469_1 [Eumeta japonica]
MMKDDNRCTNHMIKNTLEMGFAAEYKILHDELKWKTFLDGYKVKRPSEPLGLRASPRGESGQRGAADEKKVCGLNVDRNGNADRKDGATWRDRCLQSSRRSAARYASNKLRSSLMVIDSLHPVWAVWPAVAVAFTCAHPICTDRMRTGKRNRHRRPDSPDPNPKSKRDDISINQLT